MTTQVADVALERESLSRADRSEPTESWGARAVTRLGQWLCALHGHEMVRHFESQRVTLRCVACGYHTPGWTTDDVRRPQPRYAGDAARHRMTPDIDPRRN